MAKQFLQMLWEYWNGIFLFLWQLPQNILGILWLNFNMIFYYGIKHIKTVNEHIDIYEIPTKSGAITLGKYIITYKNPREKTIKHELGHAKQSMYLGPLYLIIIGIPSFIWSYIFQWTNKDYYWFYTESLANKLSGIK